MIVYGDPEREESIEDLVATLRAGVDAAIPGGASLADVRHLLILAGELEQGIFDAPVSSAGARHRRARLPARAATSAAAEAFLECLGPETPGPRAAEGLLRLRDAVALLRRFRGRVRIKVPEGFAFYGLLPELYAHAAERWALERAGEPRRDVLVVGVRSIGTTLSAVVAGALRARGWSARRLTVRPSGDPFDRRVEDVFPPAHWGIVVDEGPGLSGSSMLAVADAVARSGVERVHFFPGHARGPGAAASEEARRRWSRVPCHLARLEDLRWGTLGLAETLWRELHADAPAEPLELVEDLGNGAWRGKLFEASSEWPDTVGLLERPKLLCTGRSGRPVLFKFAGLASGAGGTATLGDEEARRLRALARLERVPHPLGVVHGYLAYDWVEGRPLRQADATPDLLRRIGEYIARAARPPLVGSDAREAWTRITRALAANLRESLGEDAARAALHRIPRHHPEGDIPIAGDGRLAPHEWVRSGHDSPVKVDAGGHEMDHTWVGRQPVLWDLAGAALEWGAERETMTPLFEGYAHVLGTRPRREDLEPYLLAYAAYRLGVTSHFAEVGEDAVERSRMAAARDRWRETVIRLLAGRGSRAFAEGVPS